MKFRLPETVSSAQDLMALELELREYAKWFAHNAIKQRVHAKHGTPPPALSPSGLDLIRQYSDRRLLTQQHLDELIKTLEGFRRTAPTLSITLAAPPTAEIKKTLVAWCRDNLTANVLITFQFNATLLGGMVVRCGSHVYDWSFRRQLLAERARFPEVLRHV